MKLFSRILSLLFCLLLLGGSALAADTPLDRLRDFWDTLELKDALDPTALTEDIRALAKESADLDDDALTERLRTLAGEKHLELNDDQLQQLVRLVRSLETGIETGSSLKDKLLDWQARFSDSLRNLRNFFRQTAATFQRMAGWLDKLL